MDSKTHAVNIESYGSMKGPCIPKKSPQVRFNQSNEEMADRWHRYFLGISHMFAMGICGIVLVSLGMTLPGLAVNCNSTSTALGSVFIARGLGAVMGPVASAVVYAKFPGWIVITSTLIILGMALFGMPYISNVWLLHVFFILLGFCTAITDTGVQILTRKAHGRHAGPWLGANTVFFGVSGACVPVLVFFFPKLDWQYDIVAALSFGAALFIALSPHMDSFTPPSPCVRATEASRGNWREDVGVEIICAMIVFFLIGGQVSVTAYLIPYALAAFPTFGHSASLLVVILWSAITCGRMGGLLAQRHMTTVSLYMHFNVFLMIGSLSILAIWLSGSSIILCIGISIYGVANGPTLGFLYDLTNRITVQSEALSLNSKQKEVCNNSLNQMDLFKTILQAEAQDANTLLSENMETFTNTLVTVKTSLPISGAINYQVHQVGMSIVMFGLNLGASLMPYITTFIWDFVKLEQGALLVILFCSMFIPMVLLPLTKKFATDHDFNADPCSRENSLTATLSRQSSYRYLHDHYHEVEEDESVL